jgi:hypothetical protein
MLYLIFLCLEGMFPLLGKKMVEDLRKFSFALFYWLIWVEAVDVQ